jgi:uncharacterized membrane protein YeiB
MTAPASTPTAAPTTTSDSRPRPRLGGLDALRGFALAGIIFVNIPTVAAIGFSEPIPQISTFLAQFVSGRFFTIFSLLFGVGFGMLMLSAPARTDRPRLALLRRLVVLGILGGLHQLLQPGEALLPYAVAGLIVLLPVTFLPPRPWSRILVAAAGAVLLFAATWTGGGLTQVPGLFLLGCAAGLTGLPAAIASSRRTLVWAAPLAAASILGTIAVFTLAPVEVRTDMAGPTGGGVALLMTIAYVSTFIALLHTPVRPVLVTAFSPLGRMALTNYLTATLLMVAAKVVWGAQFWAAGTDRVWATAMVVCAAILVLQWIWSTLWLRFVGQGPVERLWRMATWWDAGTGTTAAHAGRGQRH